MSVTPEAAARTLVARIERERDELAAEEAALRERLPALAAALRPPTASSSTPRTSFATPTTSTSTTPP